MLEETQKAEDIAAPHTWHGVAARLSPNTQLPSTLHDYAG